MNNTFSVLLTASALLVSANAFAAEQSTGPVAYVDSIHKWGAWELDLEPAAGGITPPGTRPLAARDAKVQLRSNSFSGLGPTVTIAERPAAPVIPVNPTPPPAAPPVVTPPAPVVPPIGGPADGLF